MKDKKYIISSRVFPGINETACPLVGQIATNSKILAYIIYEYLRHFSLNSLEKLFVKSKDITAIKNKISQVDIF